MNIIKTLELIRKKRQQRLDADDGTWKTINGTHVMIDKNGDISKGPKALKDLNKDKPSKAKSGPDKLRSISKNEANRQISDIARNSGGGGTEEEAKRIAEILDKLEPGSVITVPANSYGDDAYKYKKDKWGKWVSNNDMTLSSNDISWDFLYEDESERAFVSRSTKSEEERMFNRLKEEAKSWRNQEPMWSKDKPLSEYGTIKMRKNDYDLAGEGVVVIGRDGERYVSWGGGYWGYADGRKGMVDKSKVIGGTVEGDYYTISYGMNGMPKAEVDKLRSTVEGMPDNVRSVYEQTFRDHAVHASSEGGSFFSPRDGHVYWDQNSDAETVIHEMTHALDRGAVNVPTKYGHIQNAAGYMDHLMWPDGRENKEDFETMAKVIGYKTNGDGWFASDSERDNAIGPFLDFCHKHEYVKGEDGLDQVMPGFAAVSDAISALTQDYSGGSFASGGHSGDYWRSPFSGDKGSMQSHEYFANFCALKAMGYTDALNLLKMVTPNRYAAAEQVYSEVFKDGKTAQ